MKLLYIYLEEDYKNIPKGGYPFDNEFKILFNSESVNRKIEIISNEKFHNPFSRSIENISCIVGKNGIGKTTFFELIIAPLLWRLDGESLVGKLHLLFYDVINKEFYIQSYVNNSPKWKSSLDGKKIDIYKNVFTQNKSSLDKSKKYSLENNKFSVLPFQMNIIFHSLSPFDRIYTLLKEKLAYSKDQREHYHKRFKYIGINQIEKDEIKYEYMTIINLLNLFFKNRSKKMINNLGYYFNNISLEINDEYFEIELPKYNDMVKNDFFENFLTEGLYVKMIDLFDKYSYPTKIGKKFINSILLINLKTATSKNLADFMATLFNEEPTKDNFIEQLDTILKDLEKYFKYKKLFDKNSYDFFTAMLEHKEGILKLVYLSNIDQLKEVVANKELGKLLRYLKLLTARNIVKFNINLIKDQKKINFFRLSSGEKTLLSYFANITARISELIEIQKQDSTYDNVKNKTFLILIDEVELHLHPEWQRNFIKQLDDFFRYKGASIKLQFIIATHSPFVISDIYEDNIIYLGDKGTLNTKTFGGNIFDIFKDDFYVTNTIGAFSEQIIKELSEFLYFIFVYEKAKRDKNFFMLRDFFDLMYETDNRDSENIILLQDVNSFLDNNGSDEFKEKIQRIVDNRYLDQYLDDKEIFLKESKIIINNIGEDVIRLHLEKMYSYLEKEV